MENHEIAAIRGNLGIALLMQGKLEQAGVEFKAALAIDANSADVQYDLGNFYVACGQNRRRPRDCYLKAVQIDPENANAHYNLGPCWQDSAAGTRPSPISRKALEIRPDYAEAHNNLGLALVNRGRAGEGDRALPGRHWRSSTTTMPPVGTFSGHRPRNASPSNECPRFLLALFFSWPRANYLF